MSKFDYRGYWIEPACVYDQARGGWQVVVNIGKEGVEGMVFFSEPEIFAKAETAASAALKFGKRRIDRHLTRGDGGLKGI